MLPAEMAVAATKQIVAVATLLTKDWDCYRQLRAKSLSSRLQGFGSCSHQAVSGTSWAKSGRYRRNTPEKKIRLGFGDTLAKEFRLVRNALHCSASRNSRYYVPALPKAVGTELSLPVCGTCTGPYPKPCCQPSGETRVLPRFAAREHCFKGGQDD